MRLFPARTWLLAACALLFVAPLAHAVAHRESATIQFIDTGLYSANPTRWKYKQETIGWSDSAYTSHGTAKADTSAPWTFGNSKGGIGRLAFAPFVLGADSLSLFDIRVSPSNTGTTLTAGGDTLRFILQGTHNGVDWVSAPEIDLVNGANPEWCRAFTTTRVGGLLTTPTNANMGFYEAWRLILVPGDQTGRFALEVVWWAPEDMTR